MKLWRKFKTIKDLGPVRSESKILTRLWAFLGICVHFVGGCRDGKDGTKELLNIRHGLYSCNKKRWV